MKTHTTTKPPEPPVNTQRSDGWMRRLVRHLFHCHEWVARPAKYYDERLALEERCAFRWCSSCGRFEVRSRECLGLNPPAYHAEWGKVGEKPSCFNSRHNAGDPAGCDLRQH